MAYNGTNNLSQVDPTRPLDTELANVLGAALRETRLVMVNVVGNQHNTDGTHENGFITAAMLSANIVSDTNIVAGTITSDKLASGIITSDLLAALSVSTAALQAGCITNTQLSTGCVETSNIGTAQVTPALLGGAALGTGTVGSILIGQVGGGWTEATLSGALTMGPGGLVTLASTVTLDIISIKNILTQNTIEGGYTTGSAVVRALNSLIDPQGLCTLSGNQFTLPAGTYLVQGEVPGYGIGIHQAWLYNVTASANAILGSSMAAPASTTTNSVISGVFTIASTATFEVKHQGGTTNGTNGLGIAANFNQEVYTSIFIVRIG